MSSSTASSPKRPLAGDTSNERPSKQQKIKSEPAPTGLEGSGILDDVTVKVPVSSKTGKDLEAYLKRSKIGSYGNRIKAKRKLAASVCSTWKAMPASSQQGMTNLTGALCYRNSLMQALVHLPKFGNWLMTYHSAKTCEHVSEVNAPCVACEMRKLVLHYWSGNSDLLENTLNSIEDAFNDNKWSAGSASGQADPDEQLTWLVAKLREQLPEQVFSYFEAVNRPVLNSSTHCSSCGHRSANFGEEEGSLSIELMPRIKNGQLHQYLHKYMTYVVEDYKCDECSDKSNKKRTRDLSFSPDVLLVQLKRFDCFGRKDKHPVILSPSLNLNNYRTSNNKRPSIYQLSAIVSHRGCLSNGHYRCTAKGPDGKWNIFDDSHVSSCSEDEALSPGDGKSWTPYLLFFQRGQK